MNPSALEQSVRVELSEIVQLDKMKIDVQLTCTPSSAHMVISGTYGEIAVDGSRDIAWRSNDSVTPVRLLALTLSDLLRELLSSQAEAAQSTPQMGGEPIQPENIVSEQKRETVAKPPVPTPPNTPGHVKTCGNGSASANCRKAPRGLFESDALWFVQHQTVALSLKGTCQWRRFHVGVSTLLTMDVSPAGQIYAVAPALVLGWQFIDKTVWGKPLGVLAEMQVGAIAATGTSNKGDNTHTKVNLLTGGQLQGWVQIWTGQRAVLHSILSVGWTRGMNMQSGTDLHRIERLGINGLVLGIGFSVSAR